MSTQLSRAVRIARAVAVLLLGLILMYAVPYLFPPARGNSFSYMVGFNNHVELLTVLVFTLAFALWTRGSGLRLNSSKPARDVSSGTLWLLGILIATVIIGLKIWHHSHRVQPFFEASYFLDRYAMYQLGGRLYENISFDYGPLLFYPAVWISRLIHLPLGDAYYLTWIAQWLLGTVLLWSVLQQLPAEQKWRNVTLLIFSGIWLTSMVDSGPNYTPLRFIATSALATGVYRLYRRSRYISFASAAIVGFAMLLFYSPEQGIGFALATLLFFSICVRQRASIFPLFCFLSSAAVILFTAKRQGILDSILTFGNGDYDLPVLPTAAVSFLLLMIVAAGCVVISAFRQKQEGRLELYLVALALVAMPGGFGRADQGHIFINLMPAFIVASLVLLHLHKLRVFAVAGWCIYFATAFWGHTKPLSHRLRQPVPEIDLIQARQAASELKRFLPETQLVLAPFGVTRTVDLYLPFPVRTGRFYGYVQVGQKLAFSKVEELRSEPNALLLVPAWFRDACRPTTAAEVHDFLKANLDSLYIPPAKQSNHSAAPLCEYIDTHYVLNNLLSISSGFQLMEPVIIQPLSLPLNSH